MSRSTLLTGATHQTYATLLRLAGRAPHAQPACDGDRDRGAVSLEQVLWFVAAGVSVAVVAGILWSKIRDEANKDVVAPAAP